MGFMQAIVSKSTSCVATSKSNSKLSPSMAGTTASSPVRVASVPKYWYCKKCGTKYRDDKMTRSGCGAYK